MTRQSPQPPQDPGPSLLDRLRYHVDLALSAGPGARFLGLFGVSFFIVVVCAALAALVSPKGTETAGHFRTALWWAFIRVIDSGSIAEDKGALLRIVAVSSALAGIMVVAILIGLVSSTVEEKFEDLRRGKSPVVGRNHTLILGVSDKVYPILRELDEANANKPSTVVILSTRDKIEVEDELRERLGPLRHTRVVVRQGSPFSPQDLRKVAAGRARAIIVLAADVGGDSDMAAIKALLALRRVPGALRANHAVVELADTGRAPVIARLGGGGVETVAMRDTLARLMVQTSRQSGLAAVYRSLLGFAGAEFYVKSFPELTGRFFGDALVAIRGATTIGLRRIVDGAAPEFLINPDPRTQLRPNDALLVLAEDESSFGFAPPSGPEAAPLEPAPFTPRARRHERILVLGFRSDLERLIYDFDAYVAPGSEIVLLPGAARIAAVPRDLAVGNLTITVREGDPTSPEAIRSLADEVFDSVLLVADDELTADEADARTVITLLLLREQLAATQQRPRMISEILDPRTKDLIVADDATDFVISNEITSMLLAQVAEARDVLSIYEDLFDPEGSEIYLKSVERYAPLGVPVPWRSVQRLAQRQGEVALGCFRPGGSPLMNLDPRKNIAYKPGDKIIVLAEDDREEVVRPVAAPAAVAPAAVEAAPPLEEAAPPAAEVAATPPETPATTAA